MCILRPHPVHLVLQVELLQEIWEAHRDESVLQCFWDYASLGRSDVSAGPFPFTPTQTAIFPFLSWGSVLPLACQLPLKKLCVSEWAGCTCSSTTEISQQGNVSQRGLEGQTKISILSSLLSQTVYLSFVKLNSNNRLQFTSQKIKVHFWFMQKCSLCNNKVQSTHYYLYFWLFLLTTTQDC